MNSEFFFLFLYPNSFFFSARLFSLFKSLIKLIILIVFSPVFKIQVQKYFPHHIHGRLGALQAVSSRRPLPRGSAGEE
jgi:hypothetical protein